jgi:hypothetical protein
MRAHSPMCATSRNDVSRSSSTRRRSFFSSRRAAGPGTRLPEVARARSLAMKLCTIACPAHTKRIVPASHQQYILRSCHYVKPTRILASGGQLQHVWRSRSSIKARRFAWCVSSSNFPSSLVSKPTQRTCCGISSTVRHLCAGFLLPPCGGTSPAVWTAAWTSSRVPKRRFETVCKKNGMRCCSSYSICEASTTQN